MARGILDWVAQQVAATKGEKGERHAEASLKIAQRISCILHRENARAILRRGSGWAPTAPTSGWAQGADAWQ